MPAIAQIRNRIVPDKSHIKIWFSRNIEENLDSLYATAMRLTRNNADAEDLVAESVAKAWSAISSLDDKSRFRPWIFRILHNCFVSDYRKKSVRPLETSYDENAADCGEEVASILVRQPDEFLNWWANPEREFVNNLLREDISAAMERLPESFRITISLVNIEGFTYDEAAEVLEVSPGTIRSRMNRGRTLLQKALWEHAKDAGWINPINLECKK